MGLSTAITVLEHTGTHMGALCEGAQVFNGSGLIVLCDIIYCEL